MQLSSEITSLYDHGDNQLAVHGLNLNVNLNSHFEFKSTSSSDGMSTSLTSLVPGSASTISTTTTLPSTAAAATATAVSTGASSVASAGVLIPEPHQHHVNGLVLGIHDHHAGATSLVSLPNSNELGHMKMLDVNATFTSMLPSHLSSQPHSQPQSQVPSHFQLQSQPPSSQSHGVPTGFAMPHNMSSDLATGMVYTTSSTSTMPFASMHMAPTLDITAMNLAQSSVGLPDSGSMLGSVPVSAAMPAPTQPPAPIPTPTPTPAAPPARRRGRPPKRVRNRGANAARAAAAAAAAATAATTATSTSTSSTSLLSSLPSSDILHSTILPSTTNPVTSSMILPNHSNMPPMTNASLPAMPASDLPNSTFSTSTHHHHHSHYLSGANSSHSAHFTTSLTMDQHGSVPVMMSTNEPLAGESGLTLGIPMTSTAVAAPGIAAALISHAEPSQSSLAQPMSNQYPQGLYGYSSMQSILISSSTHVNNSTSVESGVGLKYDASSKPENPPPQPDAQHTSKPSQKSTPTTSGSRYSTRLHMTRRKSADSSNSLSSPAPTSTEHDNDHSGSPDELGRTSMTSQANNHAHTFEHLSFRTKRVKVACVPCRQQKMACDCERPCTRCRRHGREDRCIDFVPGMTAAAAQAAMLEAAAAAQAARERERESEQDSSNGVAIAEATRETTPSEPTVATTNPTEPTQTVQEVVKEEPLKESSPVVMSTATKTDATETSQTKSASDSTAENQTTQPTPQLSGASSESIVPSTALAPSPSSSASSPPLPPQDSNAKPPQHDFPPALSAAVAECNREALTEQQMSDLEHQERAKALGSPVDVAALGVNAGGQQLARAVDPMTLMRLAATSRITPTTNANYIVANPQTTSNTLSRSSMHTRFAPAQPSMLMSIPMTAPVGVVAENSGAPIHLAGAPVPQPTHMAEYQAKRVRLTNPSVLASELYYPPVVQASPTQFVSTIPTSTSSIVPTMPVNHTMPIRLSANDTSSVMNLSSSYPTTTVESRDATTEDSDAWIGDTTALGTSDDISFATRTFSSTPKHVQTHQVSPDWASVQSEDQKPNSARNPMHDASVTDVQTHHECALQSANQPQDIQLTTPSDPQTIARAMKLYGRSSNGVGMAVDTNAVVSNHTSSNILLPSLPTMSHPGLSEAGATKQSRSKNSRPFSDLSGTIRVQPLSYSQASDQPLVPSAGGDGQTSSFLRSIPAAAAVEGAEQVPSRPSSATFASPHAVQATELGQSTAHTRGRETNRQEPITIADGMTASNTWGLRKASPETPAAQPGGSEAPGVVHKSMELARTIPPAASELLDSSR